MANDISAFIPELWATPSLERFRQMNLAMSVCANTAYEGTISRLGDTVHVATTTSVTLRPYSRGTAIVYEDVTPADESLTIDQADYGSITLDDVDRAQQDRDTLALYTNELGVAIAEKMDTYVFGFHGSANSSNQISNGGSALNITASSAGSTHVYDLLVTAGMNLTSRNVGMTGRWAIVTPYYFSLLQKDTVYFTQGSALGDQLIISATLGNQPLTGAQASMKGFVGQCAGFDIYVSNNLPTDGSGNYYCLYGQGKPISFAAQIKGNFEALRRESTFGQSVRCLLLYGGRVFTESAKALGRIYIDNN